MDPDMDPGLYLGSDTGTDVGSGCQNNIEQQFILNDISTFALSRIFNALLKGFSIQYPCCPNPH